MSHAGSIEKAEGQHLPLWHNKRQSREAPWGHTESILGHRCQPRKFSHWRSALHVARNTTTHFVDRRLLATKRKRAESYKSKPRTKTNISRFPPSWHVEQPSGWNTTRRSKNLRQLVTVNKTGLWKAMNNRHLCLFRKNKNIYRTMLSLGQQLWVYGNVTVIKGENESKYSSIKTKSNNNNILQYTVYSTVIKSSRNWVLFPGPPEHGGKQTWHRRFNKNKRNRMSFQDLLPIKTQLDSSCFSEIGPV